MSRGGGRGGRGGGRGGRPQMPWQDDPQLLNKIDGRPTEAFPAYDVPIPAPLSTREKSQVRSFLLFREQVHDGPLYTATRSWNAFGTASTPRAYGQDQINQRYGHKSKATVDPFTAVEMPSSRMRRTERALPDFSERPFTKSLFPPELHATLDDEDGPGGAGKKSGGAGRKKKTMTLSKVTSLRTAEEIFDMPDANGDPMAPVTDPKKVLEALEQLGEGGDEDDIDFDLENEEGYDEEMDEAYDDEDGGDYDAEGYFDNGDDDDMGDDAGDEGVY